MDAQWFAGIAAALSVVIGTLSWITAEAQKTASAFTIRTELLNRLYSAMREEFSDQTSADLPHVLASLDLAFPRQFEARLDNLWRLVCHYRDDQENPNYIPNARKESSLALDRHWRELYADLRKFTRLR